MIRVHSHVLAPVFLTALCLGCGSADDPSGNAGATGEEISAAAKKSCSRKIDQMLSAPLVPGKGLAGLDFTAGQSSPKGLTIDEAAASGCVTIKNDAPTPTSGGGYRNAYWGQQEIAVTYNLDSRVIFNFGVGTSYRGTAAFKSRAGGAFGDHGYEIGVGFVHRDGQDFPIRWDDPTRRDLAELYDGMLATFDASAPADANCVTSRACLVLPDDGSSQAIFGARPLGFYVTFQTGSNTVTGFYGFHAGGKADCTTPKANLERMDYDYVFPGYPGAIGAEMGSLRLDKKGSNPAGMTFQEADAIECNGAAAGAPDPGYDALQWGPFGELLLEYNRASGVAYKLVARDGYKGNLVADDGANKYVLTIGGMKKNDRAFHIDWKNPVRDVTELSNALALLAEADCTATGSCVITQTPTQATVSFTYAALDVVFEKQHSTPLSFTTVWDGGK